MIPPPISKVQLFVSFKEPEADPAFRLQRIRGPPRARIYPVRSTQRRDNQRYT